MKESNSLQPLICRRPFRKQRQASITQSMIGAIPFVPYAPSMIKEAVRMSEIPVNKTYQLIKTGLSNSKLTFKGFLTSVLQPNNQLSPLGPSMAMFKSDDVNKNVKGVSNHSVKSTSKENTIKKIAGKTEVKYDFSQYEKKLVGNTGVLSKNGRTDQDAAKTSLAYNEALKNGEIKLDNEPDSDIYLEQIQAAKEGYNLWTGEELSKLESNSIIFSSLIGSVYGFRGRKISGRPIKVSKGDLARIKEKVKGNKVNTEVRKGSEIAGQQVSGSKSKVIEELEGPIIDGKRVGSREKVDEVKPVWGRDEKGRPFIEKEFPHVPKEHGFSDVIDNYSRFSKGFPRVGGDEIEREFY